MLKFQHAQTLDPQNMLIISFEYTTVTQIILCIIFLMYAATIQCYYRQESKTCNFAADISDTL